VSVALVAGDQDAAREAAAQILASSSASTLARSTASRVLRPVAVRGRLTENEDAADRHQIYRSIAALKRQVRGMPRNAIAWLEMSRQYTLLGQNEQALKAMEAALSLAPEHRFVVRSGARLLVHLDQHDRAHRLVSRVAGAATDPWLVSAEIATASLAERPPTLVRHGRRLMEHAGLPPAHLTELAASLGTLDLEAGRDRQARRLLGRSIEDPNENALAQVEWAREAEKLTIHGLQERLEQDEESFEARALAAANAGRTEQALAEAWHWFFDEPFSTEPALFGSHEAAKIMRFEEGIAFAEHGLQANPQQPVLRNNLAFCLARLDRAEQAAVELRKINRDDMGSDDLAYVVATEGLIAFRSGDHDRGRRLYLEALQLTKRPTNRALALLMLAVEEFRIRAPQRQETAELARNTAVEVLSDEARGWLDHLDKSVEAAGEPTRAENKHS
jgi:tetratricopeptide (TPR) repeat protein